MWYRELVSLCFSWKKSVKIKDIKKKKEGGNFLKNWPVYHPVVLGVRIESDIGGEIDGRRDGGGTANTSSGIGVEGENDGDLNVDLINVAAHQHQVAFQVNGDASEV